MKTKKFNPYSEPWKPSKPQETTIDHEIVETIEIGDYSSQDLTDKIKSASKFSVEISGSDDYGRSCKISFYNERTIPNPHYNKLFERYQKCLAKYKEEKKEWDVQKVIYDENRRKIS